MVDKLTEKIPTVYFTAKWVTTYDLLVLDFLGINRLVINSKQKTLTRGGLAGRPNASDSLIKLLGYQYEEYTGEET